MGKIAEELIEEEMFGCEETYNPAERGWKKTPAEKKIALIRKEISIAVKNGTSIETARRAANEKYGKGWREEGLISNPNDTIH